MGNASGSEVVTPFPPKLTFRLTPEQRDELGQVVRNAWVRWATTQPEPKSSWLVPWRELPEPDKEADRRIADEMVAYLLMPGLPFKLEFALKLGDRVRILRARANWPVEDARLVGTVQIVSTVTPQGFLLACDHAGAWSFDSGCYEVEAYPDRKQGDGVHSIVGPERMV